MMITVRTIMVTFTCQSCDIRIIMVAPELTAYSYQAQFNAEHLECGHG